MVKKNEIIEEHTPKGILERLGITPGPSGKEPHVMVYKLNRHERATLDHVRFPGARMEPIENSPLFATMQEAHKHCLKLEKEDKKYIYLPTGFFCPESEVPAKILKKIKSK